MQLYMGDDCSDSKHLNYPQHLHCEQNMLQKWKNLLSLFLEQSFENLSKLKNSLYSFHFRAIKFATFVANFCSQEI